MIGHGRQHSPSLHEQQDAGRDSGTGAHVAVTGVGFQPDWALAVHHTAGFDAGWRHSSQAANTGTPWGSPTDAATWIRSLDADGFTAGTFLSQSGVTHHYLAIKALTLTNIFSADGWAGTAAVRTAPMANGSMAPVPVFQFLSNTGAVLAGGKLHTYLAGTSTNSPVFSDLALTTEHANPIVLDSSGRAAFYMGNQTLKFVLKDSADVTIWTQDNVPSTQVLYSNVNDVILGGGSFGQGTTDTSYASGSTIDKFIPGTKILQFDSGTLIGTYKLRGMLRTDGGLVTVALVNLASADSELREISSSNTAGEQVTSTNAITFAASGSTVSYGFKIKVASGMGVAWGLELVRVT